MGFAPILALSAEAESGKDTVAQLLCEQYGFIQVAFADVLKRFLQEVFDFSDDQLWGPSGLRNIPDERYPRETSHGRPIVEGTEGNYRPHCLTPRKGLTTLGDALRECYPDSVVDYGMRIGHQLLNSRLQYDPTRGLHGIPRRLGSLDSWIESPKGVVFSDARLWRELKRVRESGGKLVRVVRPNAGLDGEAGEHITESEMAGIPDSEFHFVLNNDGTLEDLDRKVAQMMQGFGVDPYP